MLPAYQKACGESGTGTFVRMKDHVTDHTAAKKKVMFHSASQSLKNQLMKLQVTFFNVEFLLRDHRFIWTLDLHLLISIPLPCIYVVLPRAIFFKPMWMDVDVRVCVNEPVGNRICTPVFKNQCQLIAG